MNSKMWNKEQKLQIKQASLTNKQCKTIKALLAQPNAEIQRKDIKDITNLSSYNIPQNTPGWVIYQKLKHYNLIQEPPNNKNITRLYEKLSMIA